jgi:hypothetical protein
MQPLGLNKVKRQLGNSTCQKSKLADNVALKPKPYMVARHARCETSAAEPQQGWQFLKMLAINWGL